MKIKTGDKIYTKYHVRTITSIIDGKINMDNREFNIEDIRTIKVSLLDSTYSQMIKRFESFESEYRFIICDIYNNIAVSKIPQSEYNKRIKKAKDKVKFYAKNIKLLYHTKQFENDNPDVNGDVLHPVIDEYIKNLGLFLWKGLTTSDLANLISTMYLFGNKYNEEPTFIYKDAVFIND